jgi:hypothetical protein
MTSRFTGFARRYQRLCPDCTGCTGYCFQCDKGSPDFSRKENFFGSVTPRGKGVQRKLGQAEALVHTGRAYMHNTIRFCWDKIKTASR